MFNIQKLSRYLHSFLLGIGLTVLSSPVLQAGGGMVIEGDVCIIWIDFYSAHFTAYQPEKNGNKQFCENLPDTGQTIFVLDYLHKSLKDVPVSFRIIHDVTGQGSYVKLKHVEKIEDIERHTVFYQPPVVRADASLKIEHDFVGKGRYIGIVTAGHPSTDVVYTAVFPFEIGGSDYGLWLPIMLFMAMVAFILLRRVSVGQKTVNENRAGS